MATKLPFMQFYPWDWERDMAHHPPEIQAWWLLVCGRLHQAVDRGSMTLSLNQWTGITRASKGKTRWFLEYLGREKIADVTWCHNRVTVESRRMVREENTRDGARLRKQRQREREKSHAHVTGYITEDIGQRTEDRGEIKQGSNEPYLSPELAALADEGNKPPPCPHKEIVALYHEILPELSRVLEWSEDRQGFLRKRWRDDPKRQSLDWWRGYFKYVRDSPWLMGDVERAMEKTFSGRFGVAGETDEFPKVIEGRYHERGGRKENPYAGIGKTA